MPDTSDAIVGLLCASLLLLMQDYSVEEDQIEYPLEGDAYEDEAYEAYMYGEEKPQRRKRR